MWQWLKNSVSIDRLVVQIRNQHGDWIDYGFRGMNDRESAEKDVALLVANGFEARFVLRTKQEFYERDMVAEARRILGD